MKIPSLVLPICLLLTWPASLTAGSSPDTPRTELGDLSRLGTVHLPTSCDPSLQKEFERGVALLHSFFYEEARRVFTGVAEKDPECAMAYWGIAMTYYHPLWAAPDSADLASGLAAVEHALSAKKRNEREGAYVRAIEAYYKGLDTPEPAESAQLSCHGGPLADYRGRAACFSREMENVASKDPKDMEAAAFYALSLVATAPPGDATLANQLKSAAILEPWFATHRDHPGLVHYLIHTYDYPPLAGKGLPAANKYAAMAPGVPHALHMPSHIYTRLGMWPETIASNRASAEAARQYAEAYHPGAHYFDELHALDYLVYAYLQTGQDQKAEEVVEYLGTIHETYPAFDFAVSYAFGAIPARCALERRSWKEAASLEKLPMRFWAKFPYAEGHLVYARAVGAARSGDLASAAREADRLGKLAASMTDPRFRYFGQQMQLQRQAALGLVALANGKNEDAIRMLRAAAASEDSLGKHPVSPGAILPIREILGETLLEVGRPEEALKEFEASLAIYPARFNGLCGAAQAATKAGKNDLAAKYYGTLRDQCQSGDSTRPELAEAKAFLKRK